MELCLDDHNKVKTLHMEMCSYAHNSSGTVNIKICSDVNVKVFSDVHTRMGTPHLKLWSDVLTKMRTPHTYTGRWGHRTKLKNKTELACRVGPVRQPTLYPSLTNYYKCLPTLYPYPDKVLQISTNSLLLYDKYYKCLHLTYYCKYSPNINTYTNLQPIPWQTIKNINSLTLPWQTITNLYQLSTPTLTNYYKYLPILYLNSDKLLKILPHSGSILDSQQSWKSGKFQLARWSHEVAI